MNRLICDQPNDSTLSLWEHLCATVADNGIPLTTADASNPCEINAEVRRRPPKTRRKDFLNLNRLSLGFTSFLSGRRITARTFTQEPSLFLGFGRGLFPNCSHGGALRTADIQTIPGTFGSVASVPASAFGVDPNVELVAELPENNLVDTPSTQFSVVQVR